MRRFISDKDQAIRIAKRRAKSTYATQYVYQIQDEKLFNPVFYVRGIMGSNPSPIIKVKFDGSVQPLTQEQQS